MRITNIRSGRIVRIAALVFILVPLLYLIFTWSDTSANAPRALLSSANKWVKRTPPEPPKFVEGLGNYEPRDVQPREGPGEGGEPYNLPSDKMNEASESEMQYGMNIACSDAISLDRSVRDTRPDECKHWDYAEDLPTTSVIIVFHNEGFSVLMRTVHSVLNRSPKHVLKEILLVDDFSDKEDLKDKLDDYIQQFHGKVRLIRNTEREGLIRTRSRGAQESTGDVIVFLDAHCEVNTNWLPPLLAPIHVDHKVMTVPIIDGIDHKTFEYRPVYADGRHYRGIFEWGMLYKENELPRREQKTRAHNSQPYKSPTHAGGLFAINRKYFLEIGAYDPGLLIWGGENFELSFKIWQCGGSIVWVPCSKVGHVYRGFMPYNFGKLANKKKGPLITINYKRVIETWFDDKYKEFFYTREPLARYLDMGNITEQLQLKEKLQCKSFQWFMDNVAYDVFDKFPQLPANTAWGELRSLAVTNLCMDGGAGVGRPMAMQACHGFGNNQLMRLNAAGQLGVGERCVEGDKHAIKLAYCRLGTVDGPWQYDENTQMLLHRTHKKCMALHPSTQNLMLSPCDPNNAYHQWRFKEIKPKY